MLNMATMQNFEVISYKFNFYGTCKTSNNTYKWVTKVCNY